MNAIQRFSAWLWRDWPPKSDLQRDTEKRLGFHLTPRQWEALATSALTEQYERGNVTVEGLASKYVAWMREEARQRGR